MSVRDLIWISVAQRIRAKQKFEYDVEKYNAENRTKEAFMLMMADIREIVLDSNWHVRINAAKDTGNRTIKAMDVKHLPSMIAAERERREKMTPEELAAEQDRDFRNGGTYYPE